ncbi:(2Fe-2S)-binding protein [Serratia marcescens]|uniref:2Fe-2S iron-sulfur cluster-binding protein n=1 Tax=Serratia TaxID=613 RepID=UPI0018D662E3|nr:(2Fe-2S)-binding protein [Serratia marcescens]HEJ7062752.1 (2Fe-2S)-binding protein [Serratia marcescens]
MAISEVQSPREGANTTLTEHPLMLSVNGEQLHAQVMADTPLLLVLRNDLALNGPKYGCGLGDRQRLHPVQRAFIEEQAAQCGYCLNGMIMTTKALLDRNPAPSEAEIRQALSGNLCRCGTHLEILRAVQRAIILCRDEDAHAHD